MLVDIQWFGADTWYGLEILHQRGRSVKTKSQKVLGANSYVCRSTRGKTDKEPGWVPPTPKPPSWIMLNFTFISFPPHRLNPTPTRLFLKHLQRHFLNVFWPTSVETCSFASFLEPKVEKHWVCVMKLKVSLSKFN